VYIFKFQVSHSPWHIDPEIIALLIASDLHRKSFLFAALFFHLKSIRRYNNSPAIIDEMWEKRGWRKKKKTFNFCWKTFAEKSNDNECLGHGVYDDVWIYKIFSTWKLFKVDQLNWIQLNISRKVLSSYTEKHRRLWKYRIYLVFPFFSLLSTTLKMAIKKDYTTLSSSHLISSNEH
jgi:hypothetical protein